MLVRSRTRYQQLLGVSVLPDDDIVSRRSCHSDVPMNGNFEKLNFEGCKVFGERNSRVIFGEWEVIEKVISENEDSITDYVIENDRRNSAIPTLDLKGIIDPLKVPQIKKILSQLAENEEEIKKTPSCGDKMAGVFNLTFYLDGEYSFSKLYCVRSEEEAPWFNQITYLDRLFHLEAMQFGIPLGSDNSLEELK